jgi:diguanylate cyclase (GGDEF)-like protein
VRFITRAPGDRTDLFSAVRTWPASWSAAGLLAALALVLLLDWSTGSAPFQHLYYVPIVVAGMRFGYSGGSVAAVAAVLLYHLANPRLLTFVYGEADIVQVCSFLVTGVVTGRLAADARRIRALANTDDLTGLHNLRSFEVELARLLAAPELPAAVMVLDVDRLKSLNDTHGHLAGADAVRTVGRVIAAWVPSGGVACRYGGDEFVIAIPRCPLAEAVQLADDLRLRVQQAPCTLAGAPFPAGTLSLSIGVAGHSGAIQAVGEGGARPSPDAASDAETVFRAADAALYQAKRAGRNRTAVAAAAQAALGPQLR